jgi:putative endonuclease
VKTGAGDKTTTALGDEAEDAALKHLVSNGCRLIVAKYRSRIGEIDLIVEDEETLVFVEVRYRSDTSRGTGAETITATKQRRIIRTAEYFLINHKKYQDSACRFDVISLSGSISGSMNDSIDWIKRAFTLDA